MRVGRNPSKSTDESSVDVTAVPEVTVGLLTHAPFLSGYHRDALQVIRLSVLSARAHADRPIHLLVVDNGSCAEVRGWLLQALGEGAIDQLVLNRRNLGKLTALSQILLGAPSPDVVYADGDLRFRPGWLADLDRLRSAFPEAGVIGGTPPITSKLPVEDLPAPSAPGSPPEDVVVERGSLLDPALVREWLEETGYSGDPLERTLARVLETEDVRLVRDGQVAMWGAPHAMFMVTDAVRQRLRFLHGDRALDASEDRIADESIDRALDELGLLRLSVPRPVLHHVGNRLGADDLAELARLSGERARPVRSKLNARVWRRARVRQLAQAVHHWSFRVLYEPDR